VNALVRPLGDLETLVMEQVWRESPATARDVHSRLTGSRARAYTTIMTTMDRLFQKGLLVRGRVGNAWLYEPAQSRADYERSLAGALASRIVGDHGDVGLAAFVEAAAGDDLLDRLAALIEARRKR
jgi:predicted transcriptional regulator